jgi:hypothetical protein
MRLFLGLFIGMTFGAILQLGGASSHRKIVDMLRLRDLSILKLIVTAIAVGGIGIYLLDAVALAHLSIKPTYVAALIIAGTIFGAGFAVAGYGKTDAGFAILGGLVGALAYAIAHPALSPLFEVGNLGNLTIPGLIRSPGWTVALPVGALLLVAVWRWIPTRNGGRLLSSANDPQSLRDSTAAARSSPPSPPMST